MQQLIVSAQVVRLDGIRDVRKSVLFTNEKPDEAAGDAVFAGFAVTKPRGSRIGLMSMTSMAEAESWLSTVNESSEQ